jgi:hypothetical protein
LRRAVEGNPFDRDAARALSDMLFKTGDRESLDRLVADPRFAQFTREFTAQWLSLDKFSVLEPDRKRFPKLTRDTRAQAHRHQPRRRPH